MAADATSEAGVSFGYAFRVTWGFMWRSFITTLPLWFLGPVLMVAALPLDFMTDPVAWLQPERWLQMGGRFLLIMLVMTAASLFLMAVAMRWTLSDLRRPAP